MAHTFDNFFASHALPAPRGAFFAAAGARLSRIGHRLWHEFEMAGERRARQHLMMLARQYDSTSPELAREMRQAAR